MNKKDHGQMIEAVRTSENVRNATLATYLEKSLPVLNATLSIPLEVAAPGFGAIRVASSLVFVQEAIDSANSDGRNVGQST